MTLGVAAQIGRGDINDASLVNVSGRDEPGDNEVAEELRGIFVVLAVIGGHLDFQITVAEETFRLRQASLSRCQISIAVVSASLQMEVDFMFELPGLMLEGDDQLRANARHQPVRNDLEAEPPHIFEGSGVRLYAARYRVARTAQRNSASLRLNRFEASEQIVSGLNVGCRAHGFVWDQLSVLGG